MKKFILLVLALAFAAAPAFAGEFAATGTYKLESFYWSVDNGTTTDTNAYYQNDFELITTLTQGPVTATIDWEIIDSNNTSGTKELAGSGHFRHNNTNNDYMGGSVNEILDNYWVTFKAADNITFKTGEYSLDWGNKIAIYDQGGYNLGITYGLDMVDLGLTIAQLQEGYYTKSNGDTVDADRVQYLLSAAFKKAGPFTKLNFYLLADMIDKGIIDNDSYTATLIAGEFAVPVGPVALSGEFGLFGGEVDASTDAEGNYVLLVAGLKELVGFNLNAILFYSSEDMFTGYTENWSPFLIALNNDVNLVDPTNDNLTIFGINGSYDINDKLTVGGAIVPVAQLTDKDAVGVDEASLGMELDATYSYKFADNVVLNGGIGYLAGADDGILDDTTIMAIYNKLTLKF